MKKIICLMAGMVLVCSSLAVAGAPSGTIKMHITPQINKTTEKVDVWVPYPMSDAYQTISDVVVSGNYERSGIYRDPFSEAVYFHAEWSSVPKQPVVDLSFHVSQKDRTGSALKEDSASYPVLVEPYLKASPWVPADDPEMKKIAADAVKGKKGTLEKARAIYDWVVENTYRDPKVVGCGLGQPSRTLNQCGGGGKCADLSTVFVTLARAAGIPARDVYGLRLSSPKTGDITSGFHCWAEFYLPGSGWVMVDPADVRKMMLVHSLELKDAGDWREFFWNGDDLFRVVLEKHSRGVQLNGLKSEKGLNYFMYPAAQVDGSLLNYYDAKNFIYKVTLSLDK